MSEVALQQELATDMVYWVNRNVGRPLYERIRNADIPGNVATLAGPDGVANTGFMPAINLNLRNFAVSADYTFVLWSNIAAPIVGVGLLNLYAPVNGWALLYARGGAGIGSNLVALAGSGLFDIRIYNKQVSNVALAWMHTDMVENQGRSILGW